MTLQDVLTLAVMEGVHVMAASSKLSNEVRWVQVVDHPDPLPWVGEGQLYLTTAYTWPKDENGQRNLVRELAERKVSGIGLAIPGYFREVPYAVCTVAEEVKLPILSIPWELPFALIAEKVHSFIIAEQYLTIQRSEHIHRALTTAAVEAQSLGDIASVLSALVNRTVVITNAKGRVLTWNITPDDQSLESEGAIIQHCEVAVQKWKSRGGGDTTRKIEHCLICPMRLQGDLVGAVVIRGNKKPLGELDVRAVEHGAIVATLYLSHQREMAMIETRMGYAFFETLLEGRLEPTEVNLNRARLTGFDPNSLYRVAVLCLNETIPLTQHAFVRREQLVEKIRERLTLMKMPTLISTRLNRIIFLLTPEADLSFITEVMTRYPASLALGKPYRGVERVVTSYNEALSLIPFVDRCRVLTYEDSLLPRLLLGDEAARMRFIEELLAPVRDTKSGDTLVETLLTWARSGFDMKESARRLSVHVKTLQYRLGRASELAHMNLRDPETRFQLELAAYLSIMDKGHP